MSRIWLSKVDFSWLIVISHRYVLGFTIWSQLTNSISHDDAIACHLLVVICWLIPDLRLWSYDVWLAHMTHSYESWVSHMTHSYESWVSHMTHSYESWVSHMWSILDTWFVLWVLIDFSMLHSWLMGVNWWISHNQSLWVMSRVTRSMSHRGLVFREKPLYKGALWAWDFGCSHNHLYSFLYYIINLSS